MAESREVRRGVDDVIGFKVEEIGVDQLKFDFGGGGEWKETMLYSFYLVTEGIDVLDEWPEPLRLFSLFSGLSIESLTIKKDGGLE